MFFSDTGGKFHPENFWKLESHRKEADLIVAMKVSWRDQWHRRLMTWTFNHMVSRYFGVQVRDIDSGFRLYRRKLAQLIARQELTFRDLINAEVTLRMLAQGAHLQEVEVVATFRPNQSRGMPLHRILDVVIHILYSIPRLKLDLNKS